MRRVRASHVVGFFCRGLGTPSIVLPPNPSARLLGVWAQDAHQNQSHLFFFNTPFRCVQKSALYTVQVGSFASTHVFARYPDGGEAKKTITESS